jgi:hypothetical protein
MDANDWRFPANSPEPAAPPTPKARRAAIRLDSRDKISEQIAANYIFGLRTTLDLATPRGGACFAD